MRRTLIIAILAPLLLLAACGDDAREAGGVTRDDADALDDAAEMVEQQRLPADAVAPPAAPQGAATAGKPAATPAPGDTPKPGG